MFVTACGAKKLCGGFFVSHWWLSNTLHSTLCTPRMHVLLAMKHIIQVEENCATFEVGRVMRSINTNYTFYIPFSLDGSGFFRSSSSRSWSSSISSRSSSSISAESRDHTCGLAPSLYPFALFCAADLVFPERSYSTTVCLDHAYKIILTNTNTTPCTWKRYEKRLEINEGKLTVGTLHYTTPITLLP